MIPIIVISHGQMALGMQKTTEMIVGKQKELYFIGLDESNPDLFLLKLKEVLDNNIQREGILILADLYGGSPFLNAAELIMQSSPKARLISGVNLSMLLECIFSRMNMDIDKLASLGVLSGQDGIKQLAYDVENEVHLDGI